MHQHQQVRVYNPLLGATIEVDEGLANLLQGLWVLGIRTENSCQENRPGVMWIEFPCEDAARFLNLVAAGRDRDRELYDRMMEFSGADNWTYRVLPSDRALRRDEDSGRDLFEGASEIVLDISVRFPVADYDQIVQRLEAAVHKQREGRSTG
ncbi:MAG: hypothetical protein GKR89_37800 [Candidatus Latescibacteria bacterium]|nr:hypothetical protein [Candidatus Latescibacterota bacterium]